jgi:limonene 1,2-monooxygenase
VARLGFGAFLAPHHPIGYLRGLRTSREFVVNHRDSFNRAREAVMAKITENPAAAEALKVTRSPLLAASSSNVPDLDRAADGRASR